MHEWRPDEWLLGVIALAGSDGLVQRLGHARRPRSLVGRESFVKVTGDCGGGPISGSPQRADYVLIAGGLEGSGQVFCLIRVVNEPAAVWQPDK